MSKVTKTVEKEAPVRAKRSPLISVTREDGQLKRIHFTPTTENCNVDDARKAGHVKELSWREAVLAIHQANLAGTSITSLFCEYCIE